VTKEIPGMTKKKFLYNLSRSSYEKDWGNKYQKPGMGTRLMAWMLRVVPKSGPFKSLAFRAPTPEVEKMFMASFNATVDNYRRAAGECRRRPARSENENFDVGEPTTAGKYAGTDLTYDKLLGKLADHKFAGVSRRCAPISWTTTRAASRPLLLLPRKSSAAWTELQERLQSWDNFKIQTRPANPLIPNFSKMTCKMVRPF